MIKLNSPYNGKGGIIDAGTVLQLPPSVEKNLVADGNAKYYKPEVPVENPDDIMLDKLTKAELIEHAAKLGVADIAESMTKAEIIARIEEHDKL